MTDWKGGLEHLLGHLWSSGQDRDAFSIFHESLSNLPFCPQDREQCSRAGFVAWACLRVGCTKPKQVIHHGVDYPALSKLGCIVFRRSAVQPNVLLSWSMNSSGSRGA